MADKKTEKKSGKKETVKKPAKRVSKKEVNNLVEAEKIVYEKAKKAEEIEEEKEDEVHPNNKTIKSESKILRNLLLVLVLLTGVIAFIVVLNNASRAFTVDGVNYAKVQNGQLILYNTKVPVIYQGKKADYNFYLYNDPKKLQNEIPFNGSITIVPQSVYVVNTTGDFSCRGDGIIGLANLNNLYNLFGKMIKDPTVVGCDLSGKYTFISIQESNKTSIQETSPTCYVINVNNCEILAATERYMTETFSAIHNITS